jgi:hypothetical protein
MGGQLKRYRLLPERIGQGEDQTHRHEVALLEKPRGTGNNQATVPTH